MPAMFALQEPCGEATRYWRRPFSANMIKRRICRGVGPAPLQKGVYSYTRAPARSSCPWRIRKSCRDRHLEQAAAVMPPSVVVKDGMGGRPVARSFSRSTAIERLVNAMFVVIISELFQLSLQVDCVPD